MWCRNVTVTLSSCILNNERTSYSIMLIRYFVSKNFSDTTLWINIEMGVVGQNNRGRGGGAGSSINTKV